MGKVRLRRISAFVVVAALVVWTGTLLAKGGGSVSSEPGVLHYDEGGWRYSYHLTTGTEGLFERSTDAGYLRNLAPERPEHARRLREQLETELHVQSLDELRSDHRDTIEQLRALGYL